MKNAVKNKLFILLMVLAAAATLAGCGGNTAGPSPTAIQPTATSAQANATTTTGSSGGVEGEWQTFTSEEGRFSILMPSTPKEATQSSETVNGTFTVHAFTASDPNRGPEYTASYLKYPTSVEGSDFSQMLAAALRGVVGSNTLVDQKTGTVQGVPSIEGEYETGGTNYTFYKAVIHNDHLYQLFVATSTAAKDEYRDEAQKFFDSFQLLDADSGAASGDTANPGGWTKFNSPDGAFSVLMPSVPTQSTQPVPTDLGEFQLVLFQSKTSDNVVYGVGYIDYSDAVTEGADPQQLLEGGLLKDVADEPSLKKESIIIQGYPGLSVERDQGGQAHIWHQGVLVKNRLYQLIVVAPIADKDVVEPDVRRFQDSFQVMNP